MLLDPIAERIRALRAHRGLTAVALAQKIGVSRPTLWAWETGKGLPRTENLAALAEALGVSVELLKSGEDRSLVEQGLQGYIAEAKARISKLAGVPPEQISVIIEY